jgi:hypothetical protein
MTYYFAHLIRWSLNRHALQSSILHELQLSENVWSMNKLDSGCPILVDLVTRFTTTRIRSGTFTTYVPQGMAKVFIRFAQDT